MSPPKKKKEPPDLWPYVPPSSAFASARVSLQLSSHLHAPSLPFFKSEFASALVSLFSAPFPCSWSGVHYSNGVVVGLNFLASSLFGGFPSAIFKHLTSLRPLSLRLNTRAGAFPVAAFLCTFPACCVDGLRFVGVVLTGPSSSPATAIGHPSIAVAISSIGTSASARPPSIVGPQVLLELLLLPSLSLVLYWYVMVHGQSLELS